MIRSTVLFALLLFVRAAHATDAPNGDNGRPYNGAFDEFCGPEGQNPAQWTDRPNDAQVAAIGKMMGSRSHRIWHAFWHSMPEAWGLMNPEEQAFFVRPNTEEEPWKAAWVNWQPPADGVGGVDFFYMHHVMLRMLFRSFQAQGLPCIKPWAGLPELNEWPKFDPAPPPPPMAANGQPPQPGTSAPTGNPNGQAAPEFPGLPFMKQLADKYQSREYLQSKTLGQVGSDVSRDLHGLMHINYAGKPPAAFEDCDMSARFLMARPDGDPAERADYQALQKCDDPANNWLGSTATSQVNPIFYKLHGLVEMIMIEWAFANKKVLERESGTGCGAIPAGFSCVSFRELAGREPWLGGVPVSANGQQQSARVDSHVMHTADSMASIHNHADVLVDKQAAKLALNYAKSKTANRNELPAAAGPNEIRSMMQNKNAMAQFRTQAKRQVTSDLTKKVDSIAKKMKQFQLESASKLTKKE